TSIRSPPPLRATGKNGPRISYVDCVRGSARPRPRQGGRAAASTPPAWPSWLLPLGIFPRRSAHAVRVAQPRGPFLHFFRAVLTPQLPRGPVSFALGRSGR